VWDASTCECARFGLDETDKKKSKERQKGDNDVAIHLLTVPVTTLSPTPFF